MSQHTQRGYLFVLTQVGRNISLLNVPVFFLCLSLKHVYPRGMKADLKRRQEILPVPVTLSRSLDKMGTPEERWAEGTCAGEEWD
jgi:hypothetical protein